MPAALLWFSWTLIALWTLSVASAVATSLFTGRQSFGQFIIPNPGFDFYVYVDRMRNIHHPAFFRVAGYGWYYPAPAAFIYWILYRFNFGLNLWQPAYLCYSLISTAGVLFAAFRLSGAVARLGVSRRTSRDLIFSSALLSWPVYFAIQRGNIEAVLWFWLAGAIWAFASDRCMVGAVLLGVASAFKLYPVVCFALFLRERRWKELLVGAATMIGVTLAALRFLEPNIDFARRETSAGIRAFTRDCSAIYDQTTIAFDHSLFGSLKVLLHGHPHAPYEVLLHRYMLVVGIVALAVFFGRVIWLPRANQVVFVLVASITLPPTSFDYTLISLFIPWAWLLLVEVARPRELQGARNMRAAMILFASLMAPETFLVWHGTSVAGVFKATCLLALLALAAISPLAAPGDRFERRTGLPGATLAA